MKGKKNERKKEKEITKEKRKKENSNMSLSSLPPVTIRQYSAQVISKQNYFILDIVKQN